MLERFPSPHSGLRSRTENASKQETGAGVRFNPNGKRAPVSENCCGSWAPAQLCCWCAWPRSLSTSIPLQLFRPAAPVRGYVFVRYPLRTRGLSVPSRSNTAGSWATENQCSQLHFRQSDIDMPCASAFPEACHDRTTSAGKSFDVMAASLDDEGGVRSWITDTSDIGLIFCAEHEIDTGAA